MKSYPVQFSRLPYYDHLEIVHLFDTMHIEKNVIETLWRILDGRSDKEKIVKICNDIKEANHAMQSVFHLNSDADDQNISVFPWLLTEKQSVFPWLLTEKQSKDVKEVIEKIKFLTFFKHKEYPYKER
jgi:hypothetical protein